MTKKRYLEIESEIRELSWRFDEPEKDRKIRQEKLAKLQVERDKLLLGLGLEVIKHKKTVTLKYSGSGDAGGVDEITPNNLDEAERQVMEDLFYGACWSRIRGYENNDGGGGTVIFRVAGADRISVEHEHFDSTEEWSDVSSDTSACPEAILEICRQLLVTKVTAEHQYEDLYIEVHGNREAEVSLEPHLVKIIDRVQEDCDEEDVQITLEIDPIMAEMTVTVAARDFSDEYQNWTFDFPE